MHLAKMNISEQEMVVQETTELTVQWTGISSRHTLLALNKIPDIKAKTLAQLIGRRMRK
jgi:hypothetical protein